MKTLKLSVLVSTVLLAVSACSSPAPQPSATISKTPSSDAVARALLPSDIIKRGVLRVATDATYAPNEFVDSAGHPVGWEIELMRAIARKLGLKVQFTQVTFNDIFAAINSDQQDVAISSFFDTKDRETHVDMVNYFSAGTQWASRKGKNIDPDNACGLKIAVQQDSYQAMTDLPARNQTCLSQNRQRISIQALNTQDAVNEAVELGQADALVADYPVTAFAVMKSAGNLQLAGTPYDIYTYGMPVKKGTTTGKAVAKALQDLLDTDAYRIILSSWGVQDGAIGQVTINGAK